MRFRIFLFTAFIALVMRPYLESESNLEVRIINPKGWNLPDLSKLNFLKNEQVSYPGISINIIAESYRYEEEFRDFVGVATGGIFADLNNDGTYEPLFPIGGTTKRTTKRSQK